MQGFARALQASNHPPYQNSSRRNRIPSSASIAHSDLHSDLPSYHSASPGPPSFQSSSPTSNYGPERRQTSRRSRAPSSASLALSDPQSGLPSYRSASLRPPSFQSSPPASEYGPDYRRPSRRTRTPSIPSLALSNPESDLPSYHSSDSRPPSFLSSPPRSVDGSEIGHCNVDIPRYDDGSLSAGGYKKPNKLTKHGIKPVPREKDWREKPLPLKPIPESIGPVAWPVPVPPPRRPSKCRRGLWAILWSLGAITVVVVILVPFYVIKR
jgi:hypothetical protein